MLADFGESLLLSLTIISFIGWLAPFYFRRKLPLFGLRFAQINLGFITAGIVSAFGLLVYAFITTDLSLKTVALNSSVHDSFVYRIVALWSNHEGSLLLWLMCMCGFGLSFALFPTPGVTTNQKVTMLAWFHFIAFGFFLFLVSLSSPFAVLDVKPHKGLGLNPLLHDPSMTFHPPTLYFGYIGFVIPFIMGLGLCKSNNSCKTSQQSQAAPLSKEVVSKEAVRTLKLWTYIPWIFLTFGITAGSLWAYYELGWGGYWAWDPVENASVFPWLLATASLHSYRNFIRESYPKKSQALSILLLSFSLWLMSLLGTYITRSGIIASVHGFARDDERGFYLLIFISCLVILACVYFLRAVFTMASPNTRITAELHPTRGILAGLTKKSLSSLHVKIMVCLTVVLILATLSPLFATGALDVDFYNKIFVPAALIMCFAMIFVTYVKWKPLQGDWWSILKPRLLPINLGLLVVAVMLYRQSFEPNLWSLYSVVGAGTALWLLAAILQKFWYDLSHYRKKPKNSGQKRSRSSLQQNLVVHCAHAGFAFLVLGVSLNAFYKQDHHIWANEGEAVKLFPYEIMFRGVTKTSSSLYDQEQATIYVQNLLGDHVATLTPQTRLYHTQNALVSKTSLHQKHLGHLYAILGPQLETGERSLRILYQPFIILIWVGGMLMVIAGMLATIVSLMRRLRLNRHVVN